MGVAGMTETVQYLTFKLAEGIFVFDVAKVREILEFTSITKVPHTPDLCGGINLRGRGPGH
jgi:purine-binding chemotaxis protein CheW